MRGSHKPGPRLALIGAFAGVLGALTAYTAMDPYHVAWLLLRAVSDFNYTQHGWLPARNFRFWYSLLIGLAFGGIWGAAVTRDARSAIREGAAAGLLGRLIIPLGDFIVE
jgi:hypothetical protein